MANLKVSIICITYNHENFIRHSLESFIMQKSDFDFEVIIGEDCSADNTREILKEFEQKYSNIIKPIYRDKNIGAMKNFIDILYRARGEYIALCEGDDYWTDPLKLQKQVDFLDENPDYVMCCHGAKCINDDGAEWDWFNPPEIKDYYTLEDYISYGRTFIPTASLVTRNYIDSLHEWFFDSPAGDMALIMSMCLQNNGKIKRFHESMSVHRTHVGGVYSGMNYLEQQLFSIETRIYLRNKLAKEYEPAFKKGLRMILSQIISNVDNLTKSNIELTIKNQELMQEIDSLRQKYQKASFISRMIKYIRKVHDILKG
jgi:glycosyltransferase involved in cell wall biosynthesis